MATARRESLSHYLALGYPYTVINEDGSFFIEFPDLPECMTQVQDARDIAAMAEEIQTLWIETEYERGADIPEPLIRSYGTIVYRPCEAKLHLRLRTAGMLPGAAPSAQRDDTRWTASARWLRHRL